MKYRYAIDNSNHLIIKRKRKRLVTDGRFSIDKNNRLIYWLNKPASWRRKYNLPNKNIFEGRWRLDPNYDLKLILNQTKDQYKGDRLALKGNIISVDKDTLSFKIKSVDKQGQSHLRILKLGGFWQANEHNQLTFIVKKKTSPDTLTLKGNWQINKKQQVTYTYDKLDLKTKNKISNILTFEGFWEINKANRLTYILSRSLNSGFDFRVQIESPNVYPKKGVIKYRLGIGLRKDKTYSSKIIPLYGTWKFSRKLGLTFQMHYGQGRIHYLEFNTDIALTQKDKIILALKNKREEPLGINITFTHRFLKQQDAKFFLRLKKFLKRESDIEMGVRIPY